MASPDIVVTRAAHEISQNDDFDAIYERRYRKYLMLLAKEKELLKRMGGRSRRHRSSTIGNGLDTSEIDLAIAQSELKGDVDSCFYNPSSSSKQRLLAGRRASSVKDIRKLSHHRKAIFFEEDFDIKRLSVKMEEEEFQLHDDDSNSDNSSCSSFGSATSSLSQASVSRHFLPTKTMPNSRSMDNMMSASSINPRFHRSMMSKSRSYDMLMSDGDRHEDDIIPKRSQPIPIRSKYNSSTIGSPMTQRASLKARSLHTLTNNSSPPIQRYSQEYLQGTATSPYTSYLRRASLQKAKSFDSLISDSFDEQRSMPTHKQPGFNQIPGYPQNTGTIIRSPYIESVRLASTLQKARSFDSFLTDDSSSDETTCSSLPRNETPPRGLPLSEKNTMMTSSMRNLADRNVRENLSHKTLRTSSPYLERLRNAAKERHSKRAEVLRKLDTDFDKAKEIIKKYKSTEYLSVKNEKGTKVNKIDDKATELKKKQLENSSNCRDNNNNNNLSNDNNNNNNNNNNNISDISRSNSNSTEIGNNLNKETIDNNIDNTNIRVNNNKVKEIDNDYTHYTIV